MLAIVDYGMGNLRSVQKAFELRGLAAAIIRTPEDVRRADKLVVPGVGAFCDASKVMQETGLGEAIREFVRSGKPLLGICLGLQLLVDVGYEDGAHPGLGIIAGECVRFTVDQVARQGGEHLKVPHMGWNSLAWTRPVPLFKGLEQGCYVYFGHGYHVRPADPGVIGATADYGGPFVAALWKDNVLATQFHPEKSQKVGGTILQNFAML
ncbi:MAG: imidazole glycerol phosphate synthase subunit HisH [Phycisphaerae bacterium]